jgi:small-conductance mechanosensitive channel
MVRTRESAQVDTFEDFWEYEIPGINITIGTLIIAIIVTIIAYLVLLKVALGAIRRSMGKTGVPPLVVDLFSRILRILFIIIVLLVFLAMIGYDIGAFVLALSAIVGLVLAFGMSDSMNNFFAGVWIAMLRPFDKDDVVDVAGKFGKVIAVGIMATELRTPDNVTIIIPNRNVWGEPVENFTRLPIRRVNTDVGIAYGSDVSKAFDIAMKMMREHPKVLDDPEPTIFMTALADSSVNLQLRPWSKTEDYWDVLHDLRIALHDELPKAGVEIPFPQLDVHMIPAGGSPPPGI